MEQLAQNLAKLMALRLGYTAEKQAVIAYGLIAIIEMMAIAVLSLLIGFIFGFWEECLILFFGVGILRKSTGGAHAQSMESCTIISILSITLFSYLASLLTKFSIPFPLLFMLSAFLFAAYVFYAYKRVPVDTPNKRIVSDKKKKRLRNQCFATLSAYCFLSFLFLSFSLIQPSFLSYTAAIHFSVIWQLMTLSKSGAIFIGSMDYAIRKALHQ